MKITGRIGGVVATSALLVSMIGVAPAQAGGGCGQYGCRVSAESTKTTTNTSTTTTPGTPGTPSSPARPASPQAPTPQVGPVSAPAPAPAKPLTAAQKAQMASDRAVATAICFGVSVPSGEDCDSGSEATSSAAAPTPAQAAQPGRPGTPARTVRTVSVRELAQKARAEITFEKPDIGSAPCTDAGCQGAVGVPVWLWTQDFPSQTESASAGGRTVRVTDKVTKVTWDLGDGTSIHCSGSGTRYDRSMGWATSPDCGVPNGYTKAGRYTVTATFHHEISYSGAPLPSETATSTAGVPVVIGEYQAIGKARKS